MLASVNFFTNGHSQAMRLPKAFRVDVDQMMAAIAENPLPSSFLSEASRQHTPTKNPLADWTDSPAQGPQKE
jgi:antitoxin VapB